MKRLTMVGLVMAMAIFAFAFSTFAKTFDTTYKIEKTSKLGKAGCALCHTTAKGGKLNPYGEDLKKVLTAAKTKKLTAEFLKKVEKLDSDKDGKTNIEEIKAGRYPGVKGS